MTETPDTSTPATASETTAPCTCRDASSSCGSCLAGGVVASEPTPRSPAELAEEARQMRERAEKAEASAAAYRIAIDHYLGDLLGWEARRARGTYEPVPTGRLAKALERHDVGASVYEQLLRLSHLAHAVLEPGHSSRAPSSEQIEDALAFMCQETPLGLLAQYREARAALARAEADRDAWKARYLEDTAALQQRVDYLTRLSDGRLKLLEDLDATKHFLEREHGVLTASLTEARAALARCEGERDRLMIALEQIASGRPGGVYASGPGEPSGAMQRCARLALAAARLPAGVEEAGDV